MSPRIILSLRTLIWLILAGLTVEVCARLEDALRYGAPLWEAYDDESLYMYDAGEKVGKPYASYLKWKLNEAGYRGPALREGTYRIACVGASETFGIYESEGAEWPRQLERELNRLSPEGRPVEVINTAYPGMTLAKSLRQVDRIIRTLNPRLVLVYPSYAGYINREPARPALSVPPRAHWELRIQSRIDTLLKRSLPDALQDTIRGLEIRLAGRHKMTVERVPDSAVKRFERDLDALIKALRARGIETVVITHATRFGPTVRPEDRRYLTAWRKFYPMLAEDGFLDMENRMREVVFRACARASVPVIDGATMVQPGAQNFADYVHFTDQGAHAFAAVVASNLRPWLPGMAPVAITAAAR